MLLANIQFGIRFSNNEQSIRNVSTSTPDRLVKTFEEPFSTFVFKLDSATNDSFRNIS